MSEAGWGALPGAPEPPRSASPGPEGEEGLGHRLHAEARHEGRKHTRDGRPHGGCISKGANVGRAYASQRPRLRAVPIGSPGRAGVAGTGCARGAWSRTADGPAEECGLARELSTASGARAGRPAEGIHPETRRCKARVLGPGACLVCDNRIFYQ